MKHPLHNNIIVENGIKIQLLGEFVRKRKAAGKGSLIKEIISEIDPRFYNVVSPAVIPESESRYPFLYPYASAIP